MKKRFLAMFLALVMCLALLPTAAFADREARFTYEQQVPGGTITYRSDVEYALAVSGGLDSGVWYVHSCSDGVTQADILPTVSIQVDGGTFSGPVKWVEGGAFNNKTKLTSVSFPNDDIEIWGGAFRGCTSLTSVTLPGGLTNIGLGAFRGTPWQEKMGDFPVVNGILLDYQGKDTSITIPDGVTGIVDLLFTENTSLTSVTIPDSVTSIGREAFKNCTSLTNVTIGNGVTSIGDEAFNYCTALTDVTIGSSVTSIGKYAFASCKMTNVTIPESVKDIGRGAFTRTPWSKNQGDFPVANGILLEYCGKDSVVTIPGNITSIGDEAFGYNKSLTSVTIPSSVTSIRTGAFWGCDKLTSVTIPDSVTSIGDEAFQYCTVLTSVTIPNSVTSIGNSAFYDCESLTSVNIPNSVTNIGGRVFSGCTSLTNVTIPNSVTSIGHRAFSDCTGLTSVTIGNRVTSIGDDAFRSCPNLTNVTIPSSVTHIGPRVFAFCTSLKEIHYGGTQAQWEAIDVVGINTELESATIHYNSPMPDQPTTPDKPATQFSDVKAGDWFYDAVNWAVEKGITNGTGDGFSPNEDCTHGHILTFLWRAAGKPESTAKLPFTPKNSWAAGALAWAYEKGMIGADIDENAACTSADAVAYIWQAKGKPAASYDGRFTDVSKDAPYAPAVAWAADSGVTTGTSATTFGPATVCSRARIVTFLQRAFQ